MTGGRKPYRDEDLPKYWDRKALVLTEAEQATDEVLAYWLEAARFRYAADRALRRRGITFAQWRVLYIADRLVRETDDMVSQQQILRRAEMDECTAAQVIRRLWRKGLLDCGWDEFGWAYRIFVPERGSKLLAEAHGDLAAAFAERGASQQAPHESAPILAASGM